MNMMEGIVDYKKDYSVAVSKTYMFVMTRQDQKRMRNTTCGRNYLSCGKIKASFGFT